MSFRDVFWSQSQPWSRVRSWGVPRLLRFFHSALMATLRIRTTGVYRMKPYVDDPQKGALFVLWHDHTLVPLHLFQNCGIATMMSTSRAGRMQAAFWNLYGWPIIWGSTKKKESIAALREVLRTITEGGLVGFTPDGPKGPRREAHGGVVYLASKSGRPVLPIAVAVSKGWKLSTWDRYLIPKPFARVHVHMGEAIDIPANLSRAETLEWQGRIKTALDAAEAIAQKEIARSAGTRA